MRNTMDDDKGVFVVIEGIDGSGKETLLVNLLPIIYASNKRYDDIIITREPTYGRWGKFAREMLQQETDPYSNAEAAAKYFINDRIDHHAKLIEPALARGALVMCDRERYSTIAFQGAQGMDIEKLIKDHTPMISPTLVLIADCPVEVAMKRRGVIIDPIRDSNHAQTVEIEKFEKYEFQQKVDAIYKQCPTLFPNTPFYFINTNQSVEDEIADAFEILREYLPF